ncbi:MAG: hypothetical protein ACI9E1_000428 [Cryomorphaceae bacterium]|jgi:hypothetical protein
MKTHLKGYFLIKVNDRGGASVQITDKGWMPWKGLGAAKIFRKRGDFFIN